MTLDEAIEFCKEKSKNIKLRTEPKTFEQIAEWLEELKQYRAIGTVEECRNSVLKILEAYNKAVDDFETKLIAHLSDWKLSEAPFNDDETDRTREIICETIENAIGAVDEIAEQLKGGDGE